MGNYDIIGGNTLDDLIENVNKSIKNGFIPIGSFVVLEIDVNMRYKKTRYNQTMFNPEIKMESVDI